MPNRTWIDLSVRGGVPVAGAVRRRLVFADRIIRLVSASLLALALFACEQRQETTPPVEMSVGEERALEDAASMLDESRVPGNPVGEAPPQGDTTPAPQSSLPQDPAR